MSAFLSPATASLCALGEYRGYPLRLLDLRQNPNTQTTKTFASLIIVSRAIRYIQETNQPVLLFSPSSGDKAIALRDAVARALAVGLVQPEKLRIATLTPVQTLAKLRRSVLCEEPELRALNPVLFLIIHCRRPSSRSVRISNSFSTNSQISASSYGIRCNWRIIGSRTRYVLFLTTNSAAPGMLICASLMRIQYLAPMVY